MKKSIDIIEFAKSYYLLSKDHVVTDSKPIYIGGRIKLEYCLEGIDTDMIIATSGNNKRCIVLMDYSTEELLTISQKGEQGIMKLKGKN